MKSSANQGERILPEHLAIIMEQKRPLGQKTFYATLYGT